MNRLLAHTFLATSLALTIPVAARADVNAPDPIHITGVNIEKAWDDHAEFYFPGTINVTFTNTNPTTATEILFVLRDQDGMFIDQYKDVGKYAQGQSFTHGFFNHQMTRQLKMQAEKVTFADGSVWTSSGEIQPVTRRQAAAATEEQASPELDPNSPVAANPISLDRVQFQAARVSIDFTNGYVVPATQIVFALSNAAGRRVLVSNAGYYERGQHVAQTFQGLNVGNPDRVEVESATFEDGSSWTQPSN